MDSLFALIWFIANVIMIVFIVKAVKTKDADEKKKNRKRWLICLAVAFVAVVLAAATSPSETSSDETNNTTTETTSEDSEEASSTEVDSLESLKNDLKEKYDISEPSKFVTGDTTGDWKIVKVANSTPPTDYAVDYAKAYMQEGDVHYIVNFTLKTTNRFTITSNILEVKTTEYVDKEEHDASIIGEGMEYGDHFYDMETGKEVTTDSDENAGTVESDELVAAVKEAIDGAVGYDEKITDVSFDGTTLAIKVDLSGADTSILSAAEIAESRVSSITDNILQLDDQYYNTWEEITVDFGDIGKITFGKSDVKNNGFGKYFDVPYAVFEQ